ncbi:MAG TPA: alpha/beta fold hydrolase [Actinocatenispora sp.]
MVQRARNGAVELAYEELGGAGGEPLLLAMGLGTSRFWWPAGLVDELVGQGFHVVSYDERDSGESTRLPQAGGGHPIASLFRRRGGYTGADLADDAAAVLDALGWRGAHVFGHSMGGAVAQALAVRHPDRVRSMTTSAAPPIDVGMLRRAWYVRPRTLLTFARMRFPDDADGDHALGLAVARALASPANPPDEAAVRATVETDLRHGIRGFRDQQAQSRQTAARWTGGPLRDVGAPTLVLHGADDPLIRPAAGRDTAARIPGARLVVLPGVGHDLPPASWPRVAAEVRALADRAAVAAP